MSKEKETRMMILHADVMSMLGIKDDAAYRYMRKIKEFFEKSKHQHVNIYDFSEYSGLPLEEVRAYIRSHS